MELETKAFAIEHSAMINGVPAGLADMKYRLAVIAKLENIEDRKERLEVMAALNNDPL